jgi:hypothetical protein
MRRSRRRDRGSVEAGAARVAGVALDVVGCGVDAGAGARVAFGHADGGVVEDPDEPGRSAARLTSQRPEVSAIARHTNGARAMNCRVSGLGDRRRGRRPAARGA